MRGEHGERNMNDEGGRGAGDAGGASTDESRFRAKNHQQRLSVWSSGYDVRFTLL